MYKISNNDDNRISHISDYDNDLEVVESLKNHFIDIMAHYNRDSDKYLTIKRHVDAMNNVIAIAARSRESISKKSAKEKAWDEVICLLESIVENNDDSNNTIIIYKSVLNMMQRII